MFNFAGNNVHHTFGCSVSVVLFQNTYIKYFVTNAMIESICNLVKIYTYGSNNKKIKHKWFLIYNEWFNEFKMFSAKDHLHAKGNLP